jgi:hypothetical protein
MKRESLTDPFAAQMVTRKVGIGLGSCAAKMRNDKLGDRLKRLELAETVCAAKVDKACVLVV